MSKTTTNFGFTKPELKDAADITATNENWDKVDEQFSHNNIRSYTELSQFGLSDNEMSATDFTSNIDKIITTLNGNAANIMLIVQNDINPNLHASLIDKLNVDTPITFSTASHAGWLYIRFSGEAYRPTVVETNLETSNYYNRVWSCVYNKGAESTAISKFTTGAEEKVTLWQNAAGVKSFSHSFAYDPTAIYDYYLLVTNYGVSTVYLTGKGLVSGSALMAYNARFDIHAPTVEYHDLTMQVSSIGLGVVIASITTLGNITGELKFYKLIGVKPAIPNV